MFLVDIAAQSVEAANYMLVDKGTQTVAQTGIGLGSAIAVVCSWERNRSILLAVIHGTLSWLYVIYFAVTRQPDEIK
jgi:hypothetical protein